MAVLDREREVIVIRVVYDGPPEAGKTTSLQALAGSLGQTLQSPAEEYGRTLYFDWLDYTAGRFEGYQIRCQIVSVPGQPELSQRRWRIVKDADVVVFVGDSTRERVVESLESLRLVSRFLERTSRPQAAIIFQANKRDLPAAMPMDELRAMIEDSKTNIGVVESVASDGTGIRETFVFAVRLALDRVREQVLTQSLPVGRPDIDSSDALLERLRNSETPPPRRSSRPSLAMPLLQQVLAENDQHSVQSTPWFDVSVPVANDERPRSPDPATPSGSIWPPVEGRLILQEAATAGLTTHRLRSGGWAAGLGQGYRVFSREDSVYPDVELGRETLVRVARLHVACREFLSVHRCVVLSATGHGTWRLWQLVRAERTLRERLHHIERCSTEDAASRIVDAATVLCEMGQRTQHALCQLPCNLDTIAVGEHGAIYVGMMPFETREGPAPDVTASIGAQLGSVVRHNLRERGADVLAVIARMLLHQQSPHSTQLLDEMLTQMAVS